MLLRRVEPGKKGVIIYQNVPIDINPDQNPQGRLHFKGVKRDTQSYIAQVFIDHPDIDITRSDNHACFAGEFVMYSSPATKIKQPDLVQPVAKDLAPALEPRDYNAFINISPALVPELLNKEKVDITLVLVDGEKKALPASLLQLKSLLLTLRESRAL
jgi:hypothetical protein